MTSLFNKKTLGIAAILMLIPMFLPKILEAKNPVIPQNPIAVAYWWETPTQPKEKWFSPRREDDEWYKRRRQEHYKNKR